MRVVFPLAKYSQEQIRKFIFVNYSRDPDLEAFHGKAIALDVKDQYAPFPSIFIIHEIRVRSFHPFNPVSPPMLDDHPWQDWILTDGVFDDASSSFRRDSTSGDDSGGVSAQLPTDPASDI